MWLINKGYLDKTNSSQENKNQQLNSQSLQNGSESEPTEQPLQKLRLQIQILK